jgi:hypothetical protein
MIPYMLDQIILELAVSRLVSHCMMHMEEINQVGWRSSLGIDPTHYAISALIIHIVIAFLFNDHVVHDA